ncbi:MAG: hypothetical protein HY035_00040 [Nitrospirae bacterium]|nr:hypothetical protein [Nitrospirota bacterium]
MKSSLSPFYSPMNEIESEVEGVIVRILVENGHSVEYGEPLFLIEPV